MLDFLIHLWPWLAGSLATGAAAGAFLHGGTLRRRPARWLSWFGAAFFAGAAAVALGAVEGAVAAAIEIALACFLAFILGAALLAAARRGSLKDHERWAVGLVPVALLWWGAVEIAAPAYEAQAQKRVAALAQGAGLDPAGFTVSGRDVTAPGALAGKTDLAAEIAATPGVRRVILARDAAPEKAPDQTASISAPPPPPAEDARPTPAALPDGEFDPAACQRALDAVALAEPVAFRPARATIDRRAAFALDKAVEAIRRCPMATIEVRGHADAGAADEALARRRALAAERYLRREGVAGRKLVGIACCATAQEPRRGAGAVDYILR
jgi:outer membrane protein OmpA-like peptidoglycan-associated protein